MRLEDYNGVQVCDKAIFFSIITCLLVFIRYDCQVFLNFCIGFGVGGCIWYWGVIWMMNRKIRKEAEKVWKDGQEWEKKFEQAVRERNE